MTAVCLGSLRDRLAFRRPGSVRFTPTAGLGELANIYEALFSSRLLSSVPLTLRHCAGIR